MYSWSATLPEVLISGGAACSLDVLLAQGMMMMSLRHKCGMRAVGCPETWADAAFKRHDQASSTHRLALCCRCSGLMAVWWQCDEVVGLLGMCCVLAAAECGEHVVACPWRVDLRVHREGACEFTAPEDAEMVSSRRT